MTSERELNDEAWERSLDSGLCEVVGGERAPDVAAAVASRLAAGEGDRGGRHGAPPSPWRQRWLAAAVLLLGAAAVIATLVANREGSRSQAPASAPSPDKQGPISVVISKAEQGEQRALPLVRPETRIAALPDGMQEVEARNLDDAGLAALIEHCPQLTTLRVLASTWGRSDPGDLLEPVSITDAAFTAIAKLSRLQRLELIGTTGVLGAGLRQLDALPLLQELKLSGFDVGDDALAALPRLPSLQSLAIVVNHGFGVAGIDAIAQCPGLRRLDLRGCSQLRADQIARLGALTNLVELDLSGVGTMWRVDAMPADAAAARDFQRVMRMRVELAAKNGAGLRTEAIASWPKLQRIVLADNPGLGADVGQVLRTKCPSLQYVDLSGCNDVDDTTVAELLGLRQLRTLALGSCPKITTTSLGLLCAAQQLREVRFADCDWLTLEHVERLIVNGKRVANPRRDVVYNRAVQDLLHQYEGSFGFRPRAVVRSLDELDNVPPDVEIIELRGLGDEAAALLAKRRGLRGVEFVGEHKTAVLTDVGLRALAGIQSLQELKLMGAHTISTNGFAEIAALQELQVLCVTSTVLDDDALQVLPKLPALRSLDLTGVRSFGDRGAQAIAACAGLHQLTLRRCDQLASAAVARLGSLTALEELDLSEVPGVDDAALKALRPLVQLRQLGLAECKGFTNDGLLELPVSLVRVFLGRCTGLRPDAGAILRDRFPALGTLDVSGNAWVDDRALTAILQLPTLGRLSIYDCGSTTAASLPPLLAAPSLLELEAMRLGWLTKEVVEQLRAAKPNLQVKTFVW